jgi:hypothetical protein
MLQNRLQVAVPFVVVTVTVVLADDGLHGGAPVTVTVATNVPALWYVCTPVVSVGEPSPYENIGGLASAAEFAITAVNVTGSGAVPDDGFAVRLVAVGHPHSLTSCVADSVSKQVGVSTTTVAT